MKVLDMELNLKLLIHVFLLNGLIIVDIFLITISMIFDLPYDTIVKIHLFDFILCIILLIEWLMTLYMSDAKKTFLKDRDNILHSLHPYLSMSYFLQYFLEWGF